MKKCCCSSSSSTAALPVVPEQLVAGLPGEHAQRRGQQQEPAPSGLEAGQHVAGEVRADQPRPSAQLGHGVLALDAAQPAAAEVEQLQSRRPAARPAGEGRRGLGGERLAVDRAEQLLGLPGPEAQVLGVELDELARDEQPADVHGRRPAAAEQQPDVPRPQPDEPFERVLGGLTGQLVHVVEHQQRPGRSSDCSAATSPATVSTTARATRSQRRDCRPAPRTRGGGPGPTSSRSSASARYQAHGIGGVRGGPAQQRRLARPGRAQDEADRGRRPRRAAVPRAAPRGRPRGSGVRTFSQKTGGSMALRVPVRRLSRGRRRRRACHRGCRTSRPPQVPAGPGRRAATPCPRSGRRPATRPASSRPAGCSGGRPPSRR